MTTTAASANLCRDGFVERTAHPTIPPQVDYTITDLGRGLVEMGTRVIDWTRENADTIASARRVWDSDNPAPTTARR
ncbi:winged helix-turn-helix transcriptional regulator [Nocardia sp. NPDC055053]